MLRISNRKIALSVVIWMAATTCTAADLSTGDQCVLSAAGTDVFLSVDKKTHDRLTEFCVAKDETGVAQLVALGKVLVVKAGSRAKIVDRGFLTSEVRVLEGEHAGESGFVNSEFLNAGQQATTRSKGSWLKGLASAIAPKEALRITAIAGKKPEEVKGFLGPPEVVTPIEGYPADMPGEFRDYKHGRLRVVVQFYRGRAIGATVDIDDPPPKTAREALRRVGMSTGTLAQTFETPKDSPVKVRVIRWRGEVDGVAIEEVSATMSEPSAWSLIAVRFPRSLATAPTSRARDESHEARYTVFSRVARRRRCCNITKKATLMS